MQSVQRSAARSVRRLRPQVQRQQRRFDSHSSHDAHPTGKNESFGAGFYVTITAIPVSFALYKFTSQGSDEQPYFTRLIRDTYQKYATQWADRNDLHTQLIQQAAGDRLLFLGESGQSNRHVELRFPEILNTGSPYNVPAGHGYGNIDDLISKYEKEAFAENEKKLRQLRDNTVPVEQPLPPMAKRSPAAVDS